MLSILQITKQSLSRVLNQLVTEKYVNLSSGDDKRTKILSLSRKGSELKDQLSNIQISRIKNVIKDADEIDINGFKKILYEMIDEENKKKFNNLNI